MIRPPAICLRAMLAGLLLLLGTWPSLAQCECGTTCSCPPVSKVTRSYRDGRWFVLETENFRVCSAISETPAKHLARHAEALRSAIQSRWFGEHKTEAWTPVCRIVLHNSLESYVAAVGKGSERTVGSSLVETEQGRIVGRRIDLLGGRRPFLTAALPHELTHVVLAERFVDRPMPAWADEGVAILADPKSKQSRHQADLESALAHQDSFRLVDLIGLEQYPRAERMGAFYGQSASLAKFLIDRKGHAQFLEFIERSIVRGCDSALRECYGIADAGELDRRWRRDAATIATN